MKVTEYIQNSGGKTLFSFEIIPPLKGKSVQSIYDSIDPLMEFKPAFIDVTYHREEFVYKKMPNGLLQKKAVRKRPGTVGICAAIVNKYGIDPVPHIICGGFSKEETENALIDLSFLGITNILALRGDHIKNEGYFVPEEDGHSFASELIGQVVGMNHGKYLHDEMENAAPTNFCIGIAGYPEKHIDAPNIETDLLYLKKKVDMGAEYIVTQMFYDNEKYFTFVEKCRAFGINVPIIPGIKPLTNAKQLTVLPGIFHIDIPYPLSSAMQSCKDAEAMKQVGVEWAIQQSKELIAFGVPCLHFYTMGKSQAVKQIAQAIY